MAQHAVKEEPEQADQQEDDHRAGPLRDELGHIAQVPPSSGTEVLTTRMQRPEPASNWASPHKAD
jgi:hypothetical protein